MAGVGSEDGFYVLGIAGSPVGRFSDRTFVDLLRDVLQDLLKDSGLNDFGQVTHAWFGNVFMDFWGQRACPAQEVLPPLVDEGLLPPGLCAVNVEIACATGSAAFQGALRHVMCGESDVALAIGIEKMNDPSRPKEELVTHMSGAGGGLDAEYFMSPYLELADRAGIPFELGGGRSFAMDVYALWAQTHMQAYGTTAEQIASAAAKNHTNAVDNPRAQYRFPMTVDEVLADRVVSAPLTRAMCAPTGDAAAAALVCSERFLRQQPRATRDRALRIRAHATSGGLRKCDWEDERAPVRAARRAYQQADIGPDDIDVVELHDATSFAEIHLVEDLGLCPRGQGGPFTASGATARDAEVAVNASGGLVARGHPLAATGLLMLNELALQLRGEAGDIQVPDARLALAENAGGMVGHDVGLCSITILESA